VKDSYRNWIGRLAAVTFAVSLISALFMTGTLAKYFVKASGYDTANIAKWGVEIDTSTLHDLFHTEYATDDHTYAGVMSVISHNGDKVAAPGTRGHITDFSITGTPAVPVRVAIMVDRSQSALEGWVDGGGASYEPILWTLTDGAGSAIVAGGTFDQLLDALDAIHVDLPANTDLSQSGVALDGYTISWEWPFYVSAANDVRDTFLGKKLPAPTATLVFDIVVAQID